MLTSATATRAVSAVLLVALIGGCAWTRHGTRERPLLTGVEFLGNEHVDDRDLAEAIQTVPTGWMPFASPRYLDPDIVATDVERVERFYRSRGHYLAEVRAWRLARSAKDRASLGFVIDEGPRVRVRQLQFAGLEDLPRRDSEFVTEDLPLKLGDVVTEEAYDQTRTLLRDRLRMRGWAHAQVEGEVRVYPDRNAAEVLFAADTGSRYRLGAIRVEGTEAVSRKPILWAAAIESGERYDESAIDDAQTDIYALGVFRAVSVDVGEPLEGTDRLPVTIRVRERPLQAVEVGVGGGVDYASQRVRTRVTWRHRDLFGGLDSLEATVRGGWAVVPTLVDPFHDGPIWGGELLLTRPNFLIRRHVLSARTRYDHDVEAAYDVDSARASVGVDRITDRYGVGMGYGLELYRLTNLRVAPAGLDVDRDVRPDRCPEPCLISFVEPRAWLDRRDDVVSPRRGWYAAVAFEKGGGPLGGTHEYVKALPEVRGYLTPFERRGITIAARARSGFLFPQSAGGSPSVRRFFAGGPDSHRGYAVRRLSPMISARRGDGAVPIGGDYLLESSVEARFDVMGNFAAAVFGDAGQVAFTRAEAFEPSRFAVAIGPGIRYRTPVGPIRLDVGYRLVTPGQRTLDANRRRVDEALWNFHLGIGESF